VSMTVHLRLDAAHGPAATAALLQRLRTVLERPPDAPRVGILNSPLHATGATGGAALSLVMELPHAAAAE